jgi:MYXO-CTERM domain-containing protein
MAQEPQQVRILQYGFLMLACAQLALAGDSVATPEPGTATLLALGVAGLGIAAWRRRKK